MGFWGAVRAFFLRRCPRCGQGKVYRGAVTMNAICPVCELRFEREPGYFVGSMYISYTFAMLVLGLFTFLGYLIWPDVDLGWIVLGAIVLFVPLVPITTQYARILWMYIDRLIWPPQAGTPD